MNLYERQEGFLFFRVILLHGKLPAILAFAQKRMPNRNLLDISQTIISYSLFLPAFLIKPFPWACLIITALVDTILNGYMRGREICSYSVVPVKACCHPSSITVRI